MTCNFNNISLLDASMPQSVLGESPLWHPEQNALYWVDIKRQQIHHYDVETARLKTMFLPSPIGFIALQENGLFVAGLKDGLYIIDFVAQKIDKLLGLQTEIPYARFNDGACDRQGRLYAGTMHHEDKNINSSGALYRFDGNFFTLIQPDIPVSNGLAWSPDGTTMYHADTERHTVWQYAYDTKTGMPFNRRIFRQFDDALPDGLTIDGQGQLYIAFYGGGCIECYTPKGELVEHIDLPIRHVTSCIFGGLEMKTLFITTTMNDCDKEAPEYHAYCGRILKMERKIPGLVEPRFKSF